ncbi:MAG: hypothetical protein OEV77_08885 [Nitrospira sp.]|nr:hypothetical protein [Nitrospira sp.]
MPGRRRLRKSGSFWAGLRRSPSGSPKGERSSCIERGLTRVGYASHGRIGKGILLRYLARLTGLSRQQVTRLGRRYRQEGPLSTRHGAPQHGFRRRFTATDVALLADRDALHSPVSGPATKCLRSSNNPQVWSVNSPLPLTEGGGR